MKNLLNRKTLSTSGVAFIALSGALYGAAPALAQESDTADFALEEIIVTARKRAEGLQDAPISISAFTDRGIEQRQIQVISDIAPFTPSLTFENAAPISGNSSVAIMFIRGVGQVESIPTVDLGVGLYVDGVYFARSVGGVLDLLDVERVEVLRGPQGTLFGRNTIGGAISITTRKPQNEISGHARVQYGTDNHILPSASLNVPLSDNVYLNVSASYNSQDGYVEKANGQKTGDQDRFSSRAHLRMLPSDTVEINLIADMTRERTNGAAYVLSDTNTVGFYALNPDGSDTPFPNDQKSAVFPFFHNIVLNGATCAGGPPPVVTPPANAQCYGDHFISEGLDEDASDLFTFSNLDIFGLSLQVDWELGSVDFKSITSYREARAEYNLDQDHSPVDLAAVATASDQWQATQEFQLLGSALDDRLSWIFGAYFFKEKATSIETIVFPVANFQSGGRTNNDSIASFGQATYDLNDRLSLTAGLRYTRDEKRFAPDQFVVSSLIGIPGGTPLLPSGEVSRTFDRWTPMVNLRYTVNDDLMTYFTYSEGFKSGGYTQRVFPPLPEVASFDPEVVKTFEGGFKAEFLDGRARLNGALYRTNYNDVQVTVQDVSVAPIILNAAKARIWGGELEMMAVLAPGLIIEAGVGYINAEFIETAPGSQVTTQDKLIKTPKWTTSVGLSYEVPLEGDWSMTPRVDWSYRARTENNSINSPQASQPAYHLLSAGITFENEDSGWSVLARVKNLTDERFITGAFSDDISLGLTELVLDRGRQWSVTLRRRF
ncbi:MAG: TonB-dependent receptor [Kordiimonadaceae bacterium]|nr:TonB-dependent receptor [Kordiimonadaceae bacterium]